MLGNLTMRNGELEAPFVMGMIQHLPQVLDFSAKLLDDTMAYCNIIIYSRELDDLLLMGVNQHPPQVLDFIMELSDDMLTCRNIIAHIHELSILPLAGFGRCRRPRRQVLFVTDWISEHTLLW